MTSPLQFLALSWHELPEIKWNILVMKLLCYNYILTKKNMVSKDHSSRHLKDLFSACLLCLLTQNQATSVCLVQSILYVLPSVPHTGSYKPMHITSGHIAREVLISHSPSCSRVRETSRHWAASKKQSLSAS